MIYAFILSLLVFFASGIPAKKETPQVRAILCNLPQGPAKISDFKDCRKVNLSIDPGAEKKYEGARIIQYTFAIAPKKARTPRFVEEVKGNTVTQNALGRIPSAAPGDIVVLANVTIRTKAGIEEANGARYTIIAE